MTPTLTLPDTIDTLLLDLDGTLLDLAFDTHFWTEVVPEYYGRRLGLTGPEAYEQHIRPKLRSAEGTLDWYSLDYWAIASRGCPGRGTSCVASGPWAGAWCW
jgi:FMN phosphatase YigB (HAD superfamily)